MERRKSRIKKKNALKRKINGINYFKSVNNNDTFQPYRNIIGDLEAYYTQLTHDLSKEYYAEGFSKYRLVRRLFQNKKLADTYEGRNDLFVSGRDEMKKNSCLF
jgi:hypothetical protein